MPKTNEFCDYVADLLAPLGTVTYRFMFGGYAIYLDGLLIAIVADDALLLRADEENRGDFEARGIGAFRPSADNPGTMPFYQVPDDVFEDQDELLRWTEKARAATLRKEERKRGKEAAKGTARGGKKKKKT